MNLTWLEDLQALAETGSFLRAAKRRNVTQPAFSRRIHALEDWVGASLFDRNARTLTEAGRRLQPAAGEILHRVSVAREDARAVASGARAPLRVAATHVLSFSFLPRWLRRLEDVHVQPALHLVSNSLEACEELMLAGQVEFLLCHHHPAAPSRLQRGGFKAIEVGRDVLSPVTAPDPHGKPRFTLDGGMAVPHLSYSRESGLGRIVLARRDGGGQTPDPVFVSHLAAALRTMARDGRGVAWLPMSLVAADLADGSLVRAGDPGRDIAVGIRLFRPATMQSPAAESFWSVAGGQGTDGRGTEGRGTEGRA